MLRVVGSIKQMLTGLIGKQVANAERVRRISGGWILLFRHRPFIGTMNDIIQAKPAIDSIAFSKIQLVLDVVQQ